MELELSGTAKKQLARVPERWQGYRAIRLSDAYRAIYIVRGQGVVETVYVEEVNKHDY